MRVLVAIDGSESAARAMDLVQGLRWPSGSTIRVLSVVRAAIDPSLGIPGAVSAPWAVERMAAAARAEAERVATVAAQGLRASDRKVDWRVVEGRPASAIVDMAKDIRADLLVVGRQGRGRVAEAALGSVSTEVVESAPCAVIVARRPSIGRLVLADDGSPDAGIARQVVATMPGFRRLPVRVVSVTELSPSWYGWLGPAAAGDTQAFEDAIVADRRRYAAVTGRAVELLKSAGLDADADVRSGDAGHEIVATAGEFGADLIVIGSRGQTGLARLLLGSVARKVLQHAECSVLVVPRPREPEGGDERPD